MGFLKYIQILVLIIFTSCSSSTLSRGPASPDDPENYEVVDGGMINMIPNGSYIEGSAAFGGTQPDYYIDLEAPAIERLRETSRGIGDDSRLSFWQKVRKITKLVSLEALREKEYDSKPYVEIIDLYREEGLDIPLSEYIECSAGVCRENAILTHVLLRDAGIENSHIYAKVQIIYDSEVFIEDHAFNTVRYQNENWVIDSYFQSFNGHLLDDLLSDNGATEKSRLAPIRKIRENHSLGPRKIIQIHRFPRVWIPKEAMKNCLGRDLGEILDNLGP